MFTDSSKFAYFIRYEFFGAINEYAKFVSDIQTAMAIELIVFIVLLIIVGRKKEKTPPSTP
jgi:hypothetical protein